MSQSDTTPSEYRETRYLVLDDRLIDETHEAQLTLGEIVKHPQNPLFGEEKPWEPRFDNVYANVIYDVTDLTGVTVPSPSQHCDRTVGQATNLSPPIGPRF